MLQLLIHLSFRWSVDDTHPALGQGKAMCKFCHNTNRHHSCPPKSQNRLLASCCWLKGIINTTFFWSQIKKSEEDLKHPPDQMSYSSTLCSMLDDQYGWGGPKGPFSCCTFLRVYLHASNLPQARVLCHWSCCLWIFKLHLWIGWFMLF